MERLKQALESAVEGMPSEQWSRHPVEGKWCAAEILEHLYLSYVGTINGFERVMRAGKPLATRASLLHRVKALVVVEFGYMPSGAKAPDVAKPKGLGVERVLGDVGEKIVAMDAIITECEARFGSGIKVLDHPILGPLTAPQWRKLHLVHGLHHRKQLLRLRGGAGAR